MNTLQKIALGVGALAIIFLSVADREGWGWTSALGVTSILVIMVTLVVYVLVGRKNKRPPNSN